MIGLIFRLGIIEEEWFLFRYRFKLDEYLEMDQVKILQLD